MTALDIIVATNAFKQKEQPATLCPTCESAVLWIDPYGNAHCPGCDPPAAVAMVRRKVVVQHGTGPGGIDQLVDLADAGGAIRATGEHGGLNESAGAYAVGPPPGVGYDEWFGSLPDFSGVSTKKIVIRKGLGGGRGGRGSRGAGKGKQEQGERFALTNEVKGTKNSRKRRSQ